MRKNNLLLLILSVLLLCTLSKPFAAGFDITLEEAVDRALERNSRIYQSDQDLELSRLNYIKAMGLGLIGGAIDVDPQGGSVLSRAAREYHGEPAYQVGEALGYAVPYMGAAKAVSGVSKAPRLAKIGAKLPGLVRAGVRGAATGATAAGFRETGRAIQGREADISQVGEEAALFGAADIALRGGGRLAKRLLKAKPKPVAAPVVEAVKAKKVPPSAVDKLEGYYKSISASQKLTAEQAKAKGIALRQTKGGKIVPSVRKAGPFVPEEFAKYKDFKDARAGMLGGTKDPTRMIQEIDGALSVAKKVKLPGQAGPTEKYVLWRTRDISKMKINWKGTQERKLKKVFAGISDKDAAIAKFLGYTTDKGLSHAPVWVKWATSVTGDITPKNKEPKAKAAKKNPPSQAPKGDTKMLERLLSLAEKQQVTINKIVALAA